MGGFKEIDEMRRAFPCTIEEAVDFLDVLMFGYMRLAVAFDEQMESADDSPYESCAKVKSALQLAEKDNPLRQHFPGVAAGDDVAAELLLLHFRACARMSAKEREASPWSKEYVPPSRYLK